jgi:hypothetical protein
MVSTSCAPVPNQLPSSNDLPNSEETENLSAEHADEDKVFLVPRTYRLNCGARKGFESVGIEKGPVGRFEGS